MTKCLIPRSAQVTRRPDLRCFCQFCAQKRSRKTSYKLRDGPIDYWFCSDAHALEWLYWRHKRADVNAVLHLTPGERLKVLKGRTIEEFCKGSA